MYVVVHMTATWSSRVGDESSGWSRTGGGGRSSDWSRAGGGGGSVVERPWPLPFPLPLPLPVLGRPGPTVAAAPEDVPSPPAGLSSL